MVIATGVLLIQVMLSIVIYENANALLLLKNRLGHCYLACCMFECSCCNLASCIKKVFSRCLLNVWSYVHQCDSSLYKCSALEPEYLTRIF